MTAKKRQSNTPEDRIAADAVAIAYQIHTALGGALLEGAYQVIFCHMLRKRGYKVETEVSVPIEFDGLKIGAGFRADIVVDDLVIIELKSVAAIQPVFLKQLLTYLRLAKKRLGLLINFGAASMKDQIKRVVNGLPDD